MLKLLKRVIKLIMVLALLLPSIYLYSRYIEPNMLISTKYEINIPEDVSNCRIVFFSDTHFGHLYNQKNIEKIVEKINFQKPDIVIFGGDFFDNFAKDRNLIDLIYLQEQLNLIKAKYGKYAVFGNHDYGGGAVRIYSEFMNKSGFEVIKDSSKLIDEFNIRIIGFDDFLLGDTNSTFYNIKSEAYNILISHEPDIVNRIITPNNSLMIAGHSHGGQVELPFITEKVVPIGAKEYMDGKYKSVGVNKNIDLLVSKGIGMTKYPYRLLNVPEILVVDLI